MVDCGFGLKETQKRLSELGVCAQDLDAILVTHEHQDHISGVESLAAKFDIDVFMSEGTSRAWRSRGRVQPTLIRAGDTFSIGGVSIEPVAVPHDAKEPVQFVFSHAGQHVGILTDLGCLTKHIYDKYRKCQALLIEANHDMQMLAEGNYPFSLKRRVGSDWGHLNNQQTADFLSQILSSNQLKHIIIGHISEQNNHLSKIQAELKNKDILSSQICFAMQGEPLHWIKLDGRVS